MYKLGILASTKGTDLQAIIDEIKAGKMPGIKIAVVISNKQNAFALERAHREGIEAIFLDPKEKTKETYDTELAQKLKQHEVDLVCLIGYMRILTPEFVRQFPRCIINVHPSLMPKFSGAGFYGQNVHEQVLKSGEKETGCTIHFVDEGVDTGEIIVQERTTVDPNDTVETLTLKVQELEKKLYPEVIRRFAEGKIR